MSKRPPPRRAGAPAGPAPEVIARVQADLERATKAHQSGDLAAAERGYMSVLERAPGQPDALSLLGVIRAERRQLDSAVELLSAAARRRPKDPSILNNLGHACLRARRFDEAIDALERAVSLKPDLAEAYGNLIQALRAAGQADRAEHFIALLRELKGGSLLADMEQARILTDVGEKDAARALLRACVDNHPEYGPAWLALAELDRWKEGDRFIADLLAQIEAATEKTVRMRHLCYAAGKVFDDIGDYDRAFRFFERANAQEDIPYDHARTVKHFDAIRRTFDRGFFDQRTDWGAPSERPVFIVGMPRSGTSLTEQILASHPDVFGAGELEYASQARGDLRTLINQDLGYPEAARFASRPAIATLAWRYLAKLERHDRRALRVTDKMPHNFVVLGLLALMFPKGTYIHSVRHPYDTCLSCYMHDFAQTHSYNRSLRDLGRYYQAYRQLMEHWDEVLPVSIHVADYDGMIADQITETRRLIAHVGLPWDDAALRFHETKRRVATPSNWQVRQPLYTTSSQRWRRYEAHLGPLMEEIDPRFIGSPAPHGKD